MTQEEKAKAYDEALAKAREFYDSPRTCFTIDQLCEIFPSLAESEDERIRKELIDYLWGQKIYYESDEVKMGDSQKCRLMIDGIAYLEKQKERGPLTKEEEYTLYRIIEYFEDGDEHPEWVELLRNIYNLPYVKQKEQKSAEIAPNQFDGVTYGMSGHSSEKPAEYPMTPSECYKPAEWSEEDDGVLEQIITAFRRIANGSEHYFSQDTAKVFEETLISLRSQSKQEWSEEDEEVIKLIESSTWDGEKLTQGEAGVVHRWLKDLPNRFSLRPSWKPSEEQMDELHKYTPDDRILTELWEQLNAL